jgi:xylulokinase
MEFLGIDIGTGGSRAVLINERGAIVASETVDHAAFASPQIGWAEQSPEDWWRASTAAIRSVLRSENVAAENIGAVGLSGQMHGSVLLDKNDKVLRPALLWCDQRTGKQCNEINEAVGREKVVELVSNPAITGFTLPKMLWVRDNEPDVWARVTNVLLPKDYIRFRLSGDKASDVADSSGTLLFDVANRRWSSEMLAAFDLSKDLMPAVFESIEITGTVSQTAANETGLRTGIPIVAGAGDNAAGAVGAGVVSPGMASATIGTSGVMFVVTDQPRLDSKGRIHTLCHAIPGRWHNTGVTQSAGLSLKWFRDNLANNLSYDELSAAASNVAVGSDGALWLPYLMGERTPYLDPDARAAFIGLTASHTRAHLVRAVMEGVAFSLRDSLEIFCELGTDISAIRIGGGGGRSALWRQIQADVYRKTVELIDGDEGAAFGAAILAGVGIGAWNSVDEACEQTIRIKSRIEPDLDAARVLDRNFKAYKLLYNALRPATEILNSKEK